MELATEESTYDRPIKPPNSEGDLNIDGGDEVELQPKKEVNLHEVMADADEVEGVGKSLLSADASLPVGWETRTSRTTGDTYYLNVATAEETYEMPTLDATAALMTAAATGDPDGDRGEDFESDTESDADDQAKVKGAALRADRGGFARGVGPLRTVEELLARHHAAVVIQAHWRGELGRRLLDQVFAAALFRRFADRDELDGSGSVVGVAVRHRKCGELIRLCGFSEAERGVGRERKRDAVTADDFWGFSGLVRTDPMGFESFMAALAHFSAK